MTQSPGTCPPPEALEALAASKTGTLADPSVSTHISSCATCQSELGRIRRNNDLLAQYATPSLAGRGSVTGTLAETAIAGYQLRREVHRGGQGVVYEALQQSTQRRVAVKVMKEGPFASAGDRARFDREVQILAQLKHPNIVAIHDSGQAGGHFYFVMDFITGLPFDEFIAQDQSPIAAKLQLFARICDAVNSAHLLGIIHRDLKPGNILIDAHGDPHILDFGLAKMADGALDATMMTVTGQFLGSAPWASPEQAQGNPTRIDLRTDVYALGVMLYQLLTGRFPYEVTGMLAEVLDRIQHTEPARPSTIKRQVNDELDTIALKCLAKDPARRYDTAGELARDIRHYLAGEPIAAKRDSYFYVLGKQVRRYRAPLAVAGVFVLLLIAGLTTSLTFWRQAAAQRDAAEVARAEAVAARDEAEASRAEAEEQKKEAKRESKTASAVSDFFVSMLASADPEKSGRDVTVREVVVDAAKKLDEQFKEDPGIESSIRIQVAVTLFQLGQYADAEPHFRKTLALNEKHFGPEHKYTLSSLAWLSFALQRQGKYEESLKLQEESLTRHRKVLGDSNPETWGAMNNLAMLYNKLGRLDESVTLYRQVLDIIINTRGPSDSMALSSLNNLGTVLREMGRLDEAEEIYKQSLELSRQVRGPEHPRTLVVWSNYADIFMDRGQFAEAEAMYREFMPTLIRVYGAMHPTTLQNRNNFATIVRSQQRYAEAEEIIREVVQQRTEVLGPDHADVALSKLELGNILALRKQYDDALTVILEARDIIRKALGESHWQSAAVEQAYGDCLYEMGRFSEAESVFDGACQTFRTALGANHRRTKDCARSLADVYAATGRAEQAAALRGDTSKQ